MTVLPNQSVPPPFDLVLDFDKPVASVGVWVAGASTMLLGGPDTVSSGTHTVTPMNTRFSPQHPLLVTVYSKQPIKLTKAPDIK